MSESSEWRWADRQGVQRRASMSELREAITSGELPSNVLVWRSGLPTFVPACELVEFAGACSTTQRAAGSASGNVPGVVTAPSPESTRAWRETLAQSPRPLPLSLPQPRPSSVPPPPRSRPLAPDTIPKPPGLRSGTTSVATLVSGSPPTKLAEVAPPPSSADRATGGSFRFPERAKIVAAGRALWQRCRKTAREWSKVAAARTTQEVGIARREVQKVASDKKQGRLLAAVVGAALLTGTILGGVLLCGHPAPKTSLPVPPPSALEALPSTVIAALSATERVARLEGTPTSASAATPGAITSAPAASASTSASAPAAVPSCVVSGEPQELAPGASKDVPLHAWAHVEDKEFAVGFAITGVTAGGVVVDGRTFAAKSSFVKASRQLVRRVIPVQGEEGVAFRIHPATPRRDTLTVGTVPPQTLTWDGEALGISGAAGAQPITVWKAPERSDVTTLRAAAVSSGGLVVAVRTKDGLRLGWTDKNGHMPGDLTRALAVPGEMGTSAVGWNGSEALVAFACRASKQAPWSIRIARARMGEALSESQELSIAEGGSGGDVMAPSVGGLAGGGWLVVWTEGKAGQRDVRGQVYDGEMKPLGNAMAFSPHGANAGQGVGVVGQRRGGVFYFATRGTVYQLWGVGIECH